jgi:hypothetical protein
MVSLDDKYTLDRGRVFISGTHVLTQPRPEAVIDGAILL